MHKASSKDKNTSIGNQNHYDDRRFSIESESISHTAESLI